MTPGSGPDGLGPGVRVLYAALIDADGDFQQARDAVPDVDAEAVIEALAALRLVHRVAGEDRFEVVSPTEAAEDLLGPRESRANHELREAARLRKSMRQLGPVYRDSARLQAALGSAELLRDGIEVRDRLAEIRDGVRHSIYTAHPTMAAPEVLQAAADDDLAMLQRGIEFRDLYSHTARRYHPTLQYLQMMSDAGATIRTASVIPSRMVLIDHSLALIPAPSLQASAALIRDEAVVHYLHLLFEFLWERGQEFGAEESAEDDVPYEIQLAILHELSEGRTDEAIARRLGVSSRTLRRHLSRLLESLGVETRFQLGMMAVRKGLIPSGGEDAPDIT